MFRTLLTLLDRPVRTPLPERAYELMVSLTNLSESRDIEPMRTAVILNQTALLATHLGRWTEAKRICQLHMAWAAELATRNACNADLLFAIQPYINEGRLLGARGAIEPALERFRLYLSAADAQTVMLGPGRLMSETWGRIVEREPECVDVLSRIYISDSLKTLLLAGDYDGGLRFSAFVHSKNISVGDPDALLEGRLACLAGLERYSEMLRLVRSANESQPWPSLVFAAYEAIAEIHEGNERTGIGILEDVRRILISGVVDHVALPALTDFVVLVGGELGTRVAMRDVQHLYEKTYWQAVKGCDEVSQSVLLERLVGLSDDPQEGFWRSKLEQLADQSWYVTIKRKCHRFPRPEPEVFQATIRGVTRLCELD